MKNIIFDDNKKISEDILAGLQKINDAEDGKGNNLKLSDILSAVFALGIGAVVGAAVLEGIAKKLQK